MTGAVFVSWKVLLLDTSSTYQDEFLWNMGNWVSFLAENSPWRVFLLSGFYCTWTHIEYTKFLYMLYVLYWYGRNLTCQVSSDVIDNDQGARQQEPDDSVKYIGDEEWGRHEDKQENEMDPCVLSELYQQMPSFKSQHKCDQPCNKWIKSMNSMISS